jgi:hypothetical protein
VANVQRAERKRHGGLADRTFTYWGRPLMSSAIDIERRLRERYRQPAGVIPPAWIPALLTVLLPGVGSLLTVWIMRRANMRMP